MKKTVIIPAIIALSYLLFTIHCFAQPNPGFENWHNEYSYQVPDDWQTLNFLSIFPVPNPLSAFKATGLDKHSGSFALKIVTIFVNNNPAPGLITDTVGGAFTGKVTLSPPAYKYGYPYTGRPEKIEFWSKYAPVANDSAGVQTVLLKWNGVSRDTIAYGEQLFGATAAYSLFQFNLIYRSNAIPDSIAILFASSMRVSNGRVGSALYVDDVALTGWVGIDDQNLYANKLKIFPNPAKENVTIQTQVEGACTLKMLDVSGKQVGVFKIQNYCANINTGLLVEGIYFFHVCDKNDKILTKEKFNVVK